MNISIYAGVIGIIAFGLVNVAGAEAAEMPGTTITAHHIPVCIPENSPDVAHCHARVMADTKGSPRTGTTPSGYGPAQFQTAYGLPSLTAGLGTAIAIVDAYDDPKAESDLNTYSAAFGLPACTTVNGCFKKVNQNGGMSYPKTNQGWALEICFRHTHLAD